MAIVKPFRAWRFTQQAGEIGALVCPPYDIIGEEERQELLRRNAHNMVQLELPRDGADPYAAAGETLRRFCETGVLAQDPTAAFYVYDIGFTHAGEERHLTGLMTRVHLEEFSKGVVLPHENTLSKAKEDRLNLMKATGFNFSCIYSLYMDGDPAPMEALLARAMAETPLSALTDADGLSHRLWAIVDSEEVAWIERRFADTRLYIADGHHRYETALNYRRYLEEQGTLTEGAEYVMMLLVDMRHPGLVVCPTHRLIRHVEHFDSDSLLRSCESYFTVERGLAFPEAQRRLQARYDAGDKAFLYTDDGETLALLTLKDADMMERFLPSLSPVSRQLDVNVLHTLVLERLLGIDREKLANQTNLCYTRQADEVMAGVRNGAYQCGFILNPTRVQELRDVAAAGEKMPQKSTYFHPKPITGLTLHGLVSKNS